MNENEMGLFLDGDTRRECPTQTDSQQRLALFWGSHFPKSPSGDLIHQSARGGWGLVARKGGLVLAADLLHHGHKVRGVGLGSECFTPEVTAQDLDEAELVATTRPTNREVRLHSRGIGLWPVASIEPTDCSARLSLRGMREFDRQTGRFVSTAVG